MAARLLQEDVLNNAKGVQRRCGIVASTSEQDVLNNAKGVRTRAQQRPVWNSCKYV